MGRIGLALALAVTTVIGLASCDSDIETFAPRPGVAVRVDSAVYHLQRVNDVTYFINVTVTVTNGSDADAYVQQDCGNWNVRRAANDPSRLILGDYGCADGSPGRPQPRRMSPGESFTQTFKLYGSNSPQTRPVITIADNTGTLEFRYVFTNPEGTEWIPVSSAPFEVVPPA